MISSRAIAVQAALVVSLVVAGAGADEPSASGRITDKRLDKEVVVKATLDDVWHCWTTTEGIASFLSPESNIGSRPGDPYELYLSMAKPDAEGRRGTQGCRLLSIIPKEMISFEWSFPPSVPALRRSGAKTHVVLRFDDVGKGRVRVRFSQLGWQAGSDWDKGYEYFDTAWDWVLSELEKRLEDHAGNKDTVEDKTKSVAKPEVKSWQDKRVKVAARYGSDRRQDFEVTLPASVERVWNVLATTEGQRKTLAPKAEIELRPWGKYAVRPGAHNQVLSYVPREMLSTSGSAPPRFPDVRKAGAWSAYFLDPAGPGKTKLRLVVVGWRKGDEWDRAFEYSLENNPVYLNRLYEKLSGTAADTPEGGPASRSGGS